MVMKCSNRRTEKHLTTVCDAVRMSKAAWGNGNDRKVILGSVGFALGFYQVIDGTKFSRSEIEDALRVILFSAEVVSELAVLFPAKSVIGLAIRVLLKFPEALLALLPPIIVLLAKRATIKDVLICPTRTKT